MTGACGLDAREELWHGTAMHSSTGRAGGIFVAIGSLGGFALGLFVGDPVGWTVLGTAAGILLAIVTWLIDHRKPR